MPSIRFERLRANETTGRIRYIEGFITGRPSYKPPESPKTSWSGRVSALAAYKSLDINYIQDAFNSGQEVIYSDRSFTVDEILSSESVAQ